MTDPKQQPPPVIPEPGIYEGVSFEEYASWDCASNSRLGKLLRSPAHLKAYIDGEDKDTPAKVLGRAIHCAALEPDDFPARYFRKPEPDPEVYRNADGSESKNPAASKSYKDHVAALEAEHPGAEALSASDFDCCLGIRDSLHAHPFLRPLFASEGRAELSIVWVDEETGVRCKARIDWYTGLAGGTLVDLKSSIDGGILDFERSIFKFGYHRQSALYLPGARAVGLPARRFTIVAAEKEPPYAVSGYRVSDGVITYLDPRGSDMAVGPAGGDAQLPLLLELYRECMTRQCFPAYAEEIREVSIPDYAWKQIDAQTAEVRRQLEAVRATASHDEEAAA